MNVENSRREHVHINDLTAFASYHSSRREDRLNCIRKISSTSLDYSLIFAPYSSSRVSFERTEDSNLSETGETLRERVHSAADVGSISDLIIP